MANPIPSDTLYGVFPFWVPTFLLYIWIADRTSRHREAPGNQIQIEVTEGRIHHGGAKDTKGN